MYDTTLARLPAETQAALEQGYLKVGFSSSKPPPFLKRFFERVAARLARKTSFTPLGWGMVHQETNFSMALALEALLLTEIVTLQETRDESQMAEQGTQEIPVPEVMQETPERTTNPLQHIRQDLGRIGLATMLEEMARPPHSPAPPDARPVSGAAR